MSGRWCKMWCRKICRDFSSEATHLSCTVAKLELFRELSSNASSSLTWKTDARCLKLNITIKASIYEIGWKYDCMWIAQSHITILLCSYEQNPARLLFLTYKAKPSLLEQYLDGQWWFFELLLKELCAKMFWCLCMSQLPLCLVTDTFSKVLSGFSSMKLL